MEAFRQAAFYAIIVTLIYGVLKLVQYLDIVHVPENYTDINGMEQYSSYRLDGGVPFTQLRAGDAICYRLGPEAERAVQFGWIAAVPGDEIAVSDGTLQVNGTPSPHSGKLAIPDSPGLRIPAQHLYVLSDMHQADSVARGLIPAIAVRGRLARLP